jgi:predicted dehydrogenase
MRIAFIGGSGHFYLKGALKDPDLKVDAVAVASDGHDEPAARKLHASLPGAEWFDTVDALLDRFRPTIVNTGAAYAHNGPINIQLLHRGLPVVSDKPVAATWDDLATLRTLIDKHAVLITEFPFRSLPPFRAARRAVRDGALGDVALATAQKSYRFGAARAAWYANRADYGSTLLWIASHGIDAIRFATGKKFTGVTARHHNVSQQSRYPGMEDYAVAVFDLDGGATGLVHADYLRPAAAPTHGDDRLRIAGSKGVVEVRDDKCILITHDKAPQEITEPARPVHRELLDAALNAKTDTYSTAESLLIAEWCLHARDAADENARRQQA